MYKKSLFLSPETVNSAHLSAYQALTSTNTQKKSFVFCSSPREYVPFERVYIEYQPIKTQFLINIERKTVDYLAVPRQRLYKAISEHTSHENLKKHAENREIIHNFQAIPAEEIENREIIHNFQKIPSEVIEKVEIQEETVKRLENTNDLSEKDEKEKPKQGIILENVEENFKEPVEGNDFQVSKPSKLSLENPLEENIQGFSEKHGSSASLLRFSQGYKSQFQSAFAPNRTSFPVKINPLYTSTPLRGRIQSEDIVLQNPQSFGQTPTNLQPLHTSLHRLQTFENNNPLKFSQTLRTLNESPKNYAQVIKEIPLQRLQSIEEPPVVGFTSNGSFYRSSYKTPIIANFAHGGATQRLQSFENPEGTDANLLQTSLRNVDFGPIVAINNNDLLNKQKLQVVENEAKKLQANRRVLVPPKRQGGLKDTFLLPNLRHTNNELLLQAFQGKLGQNEGNYAVGYYVSPYLAGYFKK